MRPGEELSDTCVIKTEKFSQSIMLWGCFSAKGVGHFKIMENTINQVEYLNVLQNELTWTSNAHFPDNLPWYFQDDNATCHHAKMVTNWIHTQPFETLTWPPNSRDMNLIENLWHVLSCKLQDKIFET